MARIRTIKPEMFQDEKLAPLAPVHRLVFLGLIAMADDAGRLLDSVKVIDAFVFPFSDDTSRESLDILARLSRISRYEVASGQRLIEIVNWSRHQKVDRPSPYVLPAPTDTPVSLESRESLATGSRGPREIPALRSRPRPTTNDHEEGASSPPAPIASFDWSAVHARPIAEDLAAEIAKISPPTEDPPFSALHDGSVPAFASPEAALLAECWDGSAREALVRTLPLERRGPCAARMAGWLAGMGLSAGLRATVADIELGCIDLLDSKPAAPPTPSQVRGFVEKVIRRRLAGDAAPQGRRDGLTSPEAEALWLEVTRAIDSGPYLQMPISRFETWQWKVIGAGGGLAAIAARDKYTTGEMRRKFFAEYVRITSLPAQAEV